MKTAIRTEDFSLRYSPNSNWVISHLTMSVPEGSCCAILGPTSAGKSTLLQSLSGLLGKNHQSAEIQGIMQIGENEQIPFPREVLFPTVGMVIQDPYVMISGIYETVREEIAFTLQNLNYSSEKIEEAVQKTLQTLHLDHLADRHPLQLSGGEVQRVALATLLVAESNILLLDEPRNSLDCEGQDTLARILRSLHGRTTVLFTDYQVDLALAVADQILVLSEGRSLFFGDKKSFLKHSQEFESILLPSEWADLLHGSLGSIKMQGNLQRVMSKLGLL